MTVGGIAGNLILFALPLLAGNLFQQCYNLVDTWVIGQSNDNAAYAAVGSVGPIINTLIGFFTGLSTGAGVVISQHFGAGNDDRVRATVHTSMLMTLILCVITTAIGVIFTPNLVSIMLQESKSENFDPEVYDSAVTYLRIYFAGVSGLMIYNMCAGIMRAVGDSMRPFLYLAVSAVTNIILDLIFVFTLHWGAAGVAYATIISQFVSATIAMLTLIKTDSCIKLKFSNLKMDWKLLGLIIKVGFPAAMQLSLTAFSNVFVQSYIAGANGAQTVNLGAWTTYAKLDQFIFLPLQSLSLSVNTFVAQNLGIGDVKRAKRGTLIAYLMSTGITVLIIVVIMCFAPTLAGLFNPDPDVVATATLLLHRLTPFYVFCCVNQIFAGALRGSGDSLAPMLTMLGSFVLFRQIYLFIMSNFISNELLHIGYGYPAGWVVCATATLIYFACCKFGSKKLIQTEKEEAAEA